MQFFLGILKLYSPGIQKQAEWSVSYFQLLEIISQLGQVAVQATTHTNELFRGKGSNLP
jgi:hypothetical protein